MELNLKKLIGVAYATDELLQDAAALGAVYSEAFSEEFTFLLELAIMEGTGAGEMLGIENSNAIIAVAKEDGQLTNTIVYENIVNMLARLWSRSMMNAEIPRYPSSGWVFTITMYICEMSPFVT